MPGYNTRESGRNTEQGAEFLDDILEDMSEEVEVEARQLSSRKRRSKHGEYLRKIEQLREEKMLRDNLADYDWDDC